MNQSLATFSVKNSLKIHVAGIMPDAERIDAERKWFGEQFAGSEWQFHEVTKPESSYLLLNEADVVVTVDSTMGYEALA